MPEATEKPGQLCHILALAIDGRPGAPEYDRSRSLAILSEVVAFCEAFSTAQAAGKVAIYRESEGMFVLFAEDRSAPLVCALELCPLVAELPSLSLRMAIHSGSVRVQVGAGGELTEAGEGIETARKLLSTCEPGEVTLSDSYAEWLRGTDAWSNRVSPQNERAGFRIEPQKLVILDANGSGNPGAVASLQTALSADGHETAGDRADTHGVAWAKAVEARIRSADTVVAIVSDSADGREMLEYQLEIAVDERRKRGRPQILPIWFTEASAPLAALNQNLLHAIWNAPEDTDQVISEVRAVLALGQSETDPDDVAVTAQSPPEEHEYHVARTADAAMEQALDRQESIVLVKGPRQIGKTSLLLRAIELVRTRGWRCAATDFRKLSSRQIESEEACYRVIASTLARQVAPSFDIDDEWLAELGPNRNLDDFVRALLSESDEPLVWFIEDADRLFSAPFASEFYGLVRSWHNLRATDPLGPWKRLTVVIGYATEAHLFIKDLSRSPFNVGEQVPMDMFSIENVADLNKRYGRPIGRPEDLAAMHALLGGHPYLTRRAFDLLAACQLDIATLLATADRDDGPFGDHLRRVLVSVTQLPVVWNALVQSLASPQLSDSEGLLRLIAAGILVRKADRGFELRFELYRRYLSRFVAGRPNG